MNPPDPTSWLNTLRLAQSEGARRLAVLVDPEGKIGSLVSDRHTQFTRHLRVTYPSIYNQPAIHMLSANGADQEDIIVNI